MTENLTKALLTRLGGRFSTSLGIDLEKGDSKEVFKWFLASVLFGARISEKIVVNTYRRFEEAKVLSPEAIVSTGWDGLVGILDSGGYVRYDFKTADKLLDVCGNLVSDYGGDLDLLHRKAKDPIDLEERIKSLGKGIGEVTANIFLRELRDVWEKAEPVPGSLVTAAARNLGLAKGKDPPTVLGELRNIWEKAPIEAITFADLEAALVRLGKDYCRKRRCSTCPVGELCPKRAGRA